MDLARMILSPNTQRLQVTLPTESDLHETLWKLLLQCLTQLVGDVSDGVGTFRVHDVTSESIMAAKGAFAKLGIDLQVVPTSQAFTVPPGILHSPLEKRIKYIEGIGMKVRFAFIMHNTGSCVKQAMCHAMQ